MKTIKNIAVIALESKKTDLIEWSYFNKDILKPHQIFAFGFAGHILEGTLNKKVNRIETISHNGFRELCNFINNNQMDAVVIFGDAEEIFDAKDLNAALKAATAQNLAVAVNRTTADFVIQSSLMEKEYMPHPSSIQKTLNGRELVNAQSENFPLAKAS